MPRRLRLYNGNRFFYGFRQIFQQCFSDIVIKVPCSVKSIINMGLIYHNWKSVETDILPQLRRGADKKLIVRRKNSVFVVVHLLGKRLVRIVLIACFLRQLYPLFLRCLFKNIKICPCFCIFRLRKRISHIPYGILKCVVKYLLQLLKALKCLSEPQCGIVQLLIFAVHIRLCLAQLCDKFLYL